MVSVTIAIDTEVVMMELRSQFGFVRRQHVCVPVERKSTKSCG